MHCSWSELHVRRLKAGCSWWRRIALGGNPVSVSRWCIALGQNPTSVSVECVGVGCDPMSVGGKCIAANLELLLRPTITHPWSRFAYLRGESDSCGRQLQTCQVESGFHRRSPRLSRPCSRRWRAGSDSCRRKPVCPSSDRECLDRNRDRAKAIADRPAAMASRPVETASRSAETARRPVRPRVTRRKPLVVRGI